MLLKGMFGHAKPGSAKLRYQTSRSGGVGVVKPYGLMMGIPADITNRYTPGAGVGSTSIFARRTKLKNSWNCMNNVNSITISNNFLNTIPNESITNIVNSSNTIPIVVGKPTNSNQNILQPNSNNEIVLNPTLGDNSGNSSLINGSLSNGTFI